jgi:manganese/zinc/iron transport system substrate-binding protein
MKQGNFLETRAFQPRIIQNISIKNSKLLLISICFLSLSSTGCQSKPSPAPQPDVPKIKPLKVAVTTDILADSVRNICGNQCEVTTLIPSTENPHSCKLTQKSIEEINDADLVIYVGLGFESNYIEPIQSSNKNAESLEETISNIQVRSSNGKRDPHLWNDPFFWSLAQVGIAEIISSKRPELAEELSKNQVNYSNELAVLGKEVSKAVSAIPPKNRILVTNHDAFEYFTDEYEFKPFAINGITPGSKVNKMKLNFIATMIIENKVPVIFFESGVEPTKIRDLQKAVRAKGWQVRIGGELASDSLGKYTSYTDMIRGNAKIIVSGLKSE